MVVTCKEGLLPFETVRVPDRIARRAERELDERTDNKNVALEHIRAMVLADPELSCRSDDAFLRMFLRARKYHVPKAFSLLKRTAGFRRKNGALFTRMDYEVLSKLVTSDTISILPQRDVDGCAVLVFRLGNWNPSEVSIEYLSRAIVLFFFHSIHDPVTQVCGYKVMLDARSHVLKHLRFATPTNLYLIYTGTQECFPGRFKGVHVLNMSLTFKAGLAIIHPFLTEKLKKRIFFHKSPDSLKEHFPESLIPVDFGGTLKDYTKSTCAWLKDAVQPENVAKLAN